MKKPLLSKRLKLIMDVKDMNQIEFAQALEIKPSSLSEILDGKLILSEAAILRLTDLFGCPYFYWQILNDIFCDPDEIAEAKLEAGALQLLQIGDLELMENIKEWAWERLKNKGVCVSTERF